MKAAVLWGAAAAVAARQASAAGTVNSYSIDDPTYGSCRLKGIDDSSDNFKYYASVSGKDTTLNNACARCIEVTRDDDDSLSVTAYVLDVCDGCSSGEVQLSSDALSELSLNSSSTGSAKVSYDFVTCPSSMLSGDVKACLMEGASYSYIPLQFYNSQKVISSVVIDNVEATSTEDTYLFYANSGNDTTSWYRNVEVSMTSTDGETKNSTFSFTSTSGCATSDVQFSVASTADGVDGSTSSGSSSSSSAALIGGIVGGIAAVLLIVGSIIFIRRRRRSAHDAETPVDAENGYLSPKKGVTVGAPANAAERSGRDSDDNQSPRSPTMEFAESYTPAASLNQPSVLRDEVEAAAAAVVAAAAAAPAPSRTAAVAYADNNSSAASSQRSARPSSHLTFNDSVSPSSPAHSNVSSEPRSNSSAPRSVSAEPTFRYSSYASAQPAQPTYTQPSAPTLAPPVVPPRMTSNIQYDDDDDRGSFDVDDMRDTEEMKSNERGDAGYSYDESEPRQYGSSYYGAPDSYSSGTVTSPQSYVRATTLRRNTSQRKPNPATLSRNSSRYNNGSMMSDTQPDAYATSGSQAPQSGPYQPNTSYSSSARGTMETDPYGSHRGIGSLRESGGYSRDSLNILGYPYSKKSQRHNNPMN